MWKALFLWKAATDAPVPVPLCSGTTAQMLDFPAPGSGSVYCPGPGSQPSYDPDSLYHEIQKLIQVRQAHTALQNKGAIEFVYARENAYPLAYVRRSDNEEILVILNPSAEPQSFACPYIPADPIYTFGGDCASDNGTITVPGSFAGFYHI